MPNAPLSSGVQSKQYGGVYSTIPPTSLTRRTNSCVWWIFALSSITTDLFPGNGLMCGNCGAQERARQRGAQESVGHRRGHVSVVCYYAGRQCSPQLP